MNKMIPPEDAKALTYLGGIVHRLNLVDDVRYCALESVHEDTEDPEAMEKAMNPVNIRLMDQGGILQEHNYLFKLSSEQTAAITDYFERHKETYEFVHQMVDNIEGLTLPDKRILDSEVNPARKEKGLGPL